MSRARLVPPAALAALFACLAPQAAQAQGTLFRAAKIYTMERDSVHTSTPAVGVRDGRIVAVGDSATVARALSRAGATYTVDTRFAGAVLFPGFVEAHSHLQSYGFFTNPALPYVGYWDWTLPDGSVLRAAPSVDSLVSTLRRASAARPDTTPLVAYGADPIYFGGTRLTRQILDRASATRPILVLLSSGHIAVANTPMLRRFRANPQAWSALTANPQTLVRDSSREPTGEIDELGGTLAVREVLFADTALSLAFLRGIVPGADLVRTAGITTATDLYFAPGADTAAERVSRRAYESAAAADSAFPRVFLAYDVEGLHTRYGDTAATYLSHARANDSEKIRTGPVKVIVDGSIQGYTGVLSTPYADAPPPGGNPIWNVSADSLSALLLPFWRDSIRIAAHLNGDSATLALSRAVRALHAAHPWPDHRTTFEHNQSAFREQYDSIRALGATVNLFPGHIWFWGPQHQRYTLGPARAAHIAAAGWASERGIPFSLHTDAPVTQAGPLFLVWAAVNRRMPDGGVLGPSQRITVGQALRAVTWGGAYLLGAEGEIGSIRPGKKADFTALERDPFAVAPERICAIRVVGTVVGGVAWTPAAPQGQCPSRPGGNGAGASRPAASNSSRPETGS